MPDKGPLDTDRKLDRQSGQLIDNQIIDKWSYNNWQKLDW